MGKLLHELFKNNSFLKNLSLLNRIIRSDKILEETEEFEKILERL